MKLIRHSQWTNLERLELLKVCSDETIEKDWGKRADVMSRRYASVGIFFTAKVLHSEFERILAAPCPGIELNMSGQYSYSHKVLIEKWIVHYKKLIDEESSKKSELAMVEIRRCTSLIEKLLADKMSLDEMADLLEKLKMENPKKEDDMQFKRVVSTYSNRLLHVWKTTGSTIINLPSQLPPTMMAAGTSSSSSQDSGFMTPTYQSTSTTSAISSPIRSVAEALKDAVPIFAEPIPPPVKDVVVPVDEPKKEQDVGEMKMEEDQEIEEDGNEEETAPDTPKQRGRPKASLPKLTPKEKKEMAESAELRRSGDSSSSLADSIVLPAPSSVKKPRLGTPAGRRRNAAAVAAAAVTDADDKKSVRSVDSFEIPSAPLTPMPSEWRDIECQTEVSIRGCSRVAASPERGSGAGRRSTTSAAAAAASTPLRKSSRRTDKQSTPVAAAAAVSTTPSLNTSGASDRVNHIGCQTGRVEFDKEDIVTLYFAATQDETHVAEVVVLDKGRKVAGKQRQGDETMMEISKEKNGTEDEAEEVPTHRRGSKSEAKREMTYVVETQANIAQKLIDEKGFKIMRISDPSASDPPSPTKRGSAAARQKDDRVSRDEATNTRFQMNTMWRILSDHKNSFVFSHPVTEKDAPGYTATIKRRVDLATLKKEIDSGVVASKHAFMLKAYNMFANATMFNSTGHDVNTYAKTMVHDVMNDIMAVSSDERKSGIASRRSKIIDDARSSQRAQSVEPEIVPLLGVPGQTRRLFRRKSATKQWNQIKKTIQK